MSTKAAIAETEKGELNICRVVCESHIDKFLLSHRNTITMVIFCNYDSKINIFMKRIMAHKFPTCQFIIAYLDKQNFAADTKKYVSQLVQNTNEKIEDNLPCALFFYDMRRLTRVFSATPQTIHDALVNLLEMKAQAQAVQPNKTKNINTENVQEHNISGNDQMMKMAREYQVEKIQEDKKMHELIELQKLDKIHKNSKKDENNTDNENENDEDEEQDDHESNNEVNDEKPKSKKKTKEKEKSKTKQKHKK